MRMTSNLFNSRIQLAINIHKQAVKKKEASRIRKTSQRTKATRALFTHHRVFNCHLFTQTSFHFGFDRKRPWIAFQVQLPNCQLLNIFIKVLMQSISQALPKNANFLKSCQLLLCLEFAQFRNFSHELTLSRIKLLFYRAESFF